MLLDGVASILQLLEPLVATFYYRREEENKKEEKRGEATGRAHQRWRLSPKRIGGERKWGLLAALGEGRLEISIGFGLLCIRNRKNRRI